jgi:hypothetical protein
MTMTEPTERDRETAEELFWNGTRPGIAAALAASREEGRREERERCAKIVDRHPDEAHPASFDPEEVRGCCEVMAARIRSEDD